MSLAIWSEMRRRLDAGETFAAATIATRDGSAPRSAGAKMLVGESGLLFGTLGGGSAEARAVDEARNTLRDGKARLFAIDMSGSAAEGADLICGGRVEIFAARVGPEQLPVFAAVEERFGEGRDSILLTPIAADARPMLVLPGREDDSLAKAAVAADADAARVLEHGGVRYLLEPVAARARAIVAGAGHVSLPTTHMAAMVDFEVTVMDDRADFAAPDRFPWLAPERILVVPGFADCFDADVLGAPVTPACCIVIVTRGHAFDAEVLAQALRTPARYVGMIGSRRKRDAVYAELRSRGFSEERLAAVRCPIGLPIGGDTPAEIAVSIVAELVARRAEWKR